MSNHVFMKIIMGLSIAFIAVTSSAASIEGYWKSIEERTGEQLSIVEIRKGDDGRFNGKIVYRYPNAHGIALTNCVKCPAPHTNKPLVGLEILSGFKQDPHNPNAYIDGTVLEATSGRIYKGKGIVTGEGKRVRMRGYMGVSALGRTVVWIRTHSGTP
ncbi:DUF2147 domain-containing protein [Acinetobacter suaedae]|uniref:DUF2147 domain-containing protein n=1 Tax=Acinetobacter suaedae TaxID=2609668 RepID=A0A5P1UUR6_9GAMM|nr:DUF2147 domain-containing protein [Acinetobacter sp. C16S1]QER39367.1 DUF2147 domain-containing protein [Acinetobacter sp. C16S1]